MRAFQVNALLFWCATAGAELLASLLSWTALCCGMIHPPYAASGPIGSSFASDKFQGGPTPCIAFAFRLAANSARIHVLSRTCLLPSCFQRTAAALSHLYVPAYFLCMICFMIKSSFRVLLDWALVSPMAWTVGAAGQTLRVD